MGNIIGVPLVTYGLSSPLNTINYDKIMMPVILTHINSYGNIKSTLLDSIIYYCLHLCRLWTFVNNYVENKTFVL